MPRSLIYICLFCLGVFRPLAASNAPSEFRINQLHAFNFSVTLDWTNNAADVMGYEIYRSNDSNGTFVFHTDASLPTPTATIYLTAAQSRGTYFKVRARTFNFQDGYQTTGFSNTILISFEGPGRQVLSIAGASGAVPEYWIHLPADYDSSPFDYPVLVYLHGSNAIGGSADTIRNSGPPKLVDELNPWVTDTFIVISPHMASGGVEQWYDPSRSGVVLDILEHVLRNYKADNLRTYLTGSDIGGTGTLGIYSEFPNQFAAALEAGGSSAGIAPSGYTALQYKPIWIHHGTADAIVPFANAETTANNCSLPYSGLRRDEYDSSVFDSPYDSAYVRFSVYTGFGHDVWTTMYNDYRVYDWLLTKQRIPQGFQVHTLALGGGQNALTPVTMNVGATGERLKFRWTKDGVLIPGATSDTFVIPAATTDDEGLYEVEVSNRDVAQNFAGNLYIYKLGITLSEPANPITFEFGTPLTGNLFNGVIVSPDTPGVFTLEAANFEGEILPFYSWAVVRFRPDAANAFNEATLTVYPVQTPRPVTITAYDLTRIYGDESIITFGQEGLLERDLHIMDLGFVGRGPTDLMSVGVHTYAPFARERHYGYDFVYVSATLTILPAPLTITAQNKTRVAGKADPAFTAAFSGFQIQYADGPWSLTSKPVFATTATLNSPPGTYPITASGAASPNYTIAYVAGTLTITNSPPDFTSAAIVATPALPVVNQQVQWSALVMDPDEHPLTYAWNFGDGSPISSARSPLHVYTAPGTYTVSMSVNDGFETVTKIVSIDVGVGGALAPVARFTTSDVVGFAGVPLFFSGAPSSDPQNSITDYAWNFGDGSVSAGMDVSKSYDASGTYFVSLTVRDGDGIAASVTRSIVILSADQADNFEPFVEFTTRIDRKKSKRDSLKLKTRLNIGNLDLGEGTTVSVEIAGQRFETNLDRKLRAAVKSAPQQNWIVLWQSRRQTPGQVDVLLTIKNASLAAGFEQLGALAMKEAGATAVPLRIQIGFHTVEITCPTIFKLNNAANKATGNAR